MSTDTQDVLERRLRRLEDQIAIYQIVCGYGYAVDGLNSEAASVLYAKDGIFAVGDSGTFNGREHAAGFATSAPLRDLVASGCAHVSTLPYVVIDGDRATATCHTILMQHENGEFAVARLSASRIELSRKEDGGWHIHHRQNYLLQGDPTGPRLLARLNEPPKDA